MQAALRAADAGEAVRRALGRADVDAQLSQPGPIDVVAAGKAAQGMLQAFQHAGRSARSMLGVGPKRARAPIASCRWFTAGHPIPNVDSVRAADAVLDLATGSGSDACLLLLVSGGASALLAKPVEGMSLEDKRATVGALLQRGADIEQMNAVRKHLSAIKGGRLACRTRARVLTLAVSDVPGDDLAVIGSGPTVADPTTYADALDVLQELGGLDQYPPAIGAHLRAGADGRIEETPKPGDARLARAVAFVVGSLSDALAGAAHAAEGLGYTVHRLPARIAGDARTAARQYAEQIATMAASASGPVCVVSGGETTVHVKGTGRGGRNQEFALVVAGALTEIPLDAVVASVGTDGVDGPTDAAGAIVDLTTLQRARDGGAEDPWRALANNDANPVLASAGDLLVTGPTDTNVGDMQIALMIGGRR